jgi:hypothetical protein
MVTDTCYMVAHRLSHVDIVVVGSTCAISTRFLITRSRAPSGVRSAAISVAESSSKASAARPGALDCVLCRTPAFPRKER